VVAEGLAGAMITVSRSKKSIVAVLTSGLLLAGVYSLATGAVTLLTPDQKGFREFQQEQFDEAATSFADPMWSGVALFRQGEFEQAAAVFAGLDTANSAFNQGNALLLQGKYGEAADRYTRALELRPEWDDATKNREIALGRAERLKQVGGDMTGGMLGADEIVFNTGESSPSAGDEQTDGGQPLSDAENRALWLRQVQTRPADFLSAKFAWQIAVREQPAAEAEEAE
jgi:Ca-activated chloride channel family protein